VSFTGLVRDHDGGRGVRELEYVATPTRCRPAGGRRGRRRRPARPRPGGRAPHRACSPSADVAVVVAASAAHRGQAFEAARRLIDDLKASVPVWKRQVFDDGEQEWVGTP
jgi:molybdopterin synthase catalytic subunit